MQITEFHIRQLFGLFDHQISFKTKDRITIIHGPNGVGKTTVLKLLLALFSRKISQLRVTPFDSIEVIFDDKSKLTLEKKSRKTREPTAALEFKYTSGKDEKSTQFKPTMNLRNIRCI